MSVAFEHQRDRLVGAGDARHLTQARHAQSLAIAVFGRIAEGEDPLGQLVGLRCRVVVELLELGMEDKEAATADVPVYAAQIRIEDLVVGQQLFEGSDDALQGGCVEMQIIQGFHNSHFIGFTNIVFVFHRQR